MSHSDRTIAVTGATGFLGSHIAPYLSGEGARVRAVVRDPAKAAWLRERGIEIAVADLADPEALRGAFEGADAVVSTAALASRPGAGWEDYYEANVLGSENLMRACAEAGVRRVVHISTVAVYRNLPFRRHDESTSLVGDRAGWARLVTDPLYGRSKAMGERRLQGLAVECDIALTVLRPGPIWGSRDPKLTARYARALDRRVVAVPTFCIPHVHADDGAAAVSGALSNPDSAGRTYNVTGEPISPWQILRAWRRRRGSGALLVPIVLPAWIDYDDAAAARDLGFRSRSIEEALDEILATPL